MRESNLHRIIMRDVCDADTRLFRNHVGYGLVIRHPNPRAREAIMSACIELAQRMGGSGERTRFGLAPDSGDLIGARREVITPEMIGQAVSIFCSVEVKTDRGKPSPGQINWADFINGFGGRAGFARNVEEARAIVANDNKRR